MNCTENQMWAKKYNQVTLHIYLKLLQNNGSFCLFRHCHSLITFFTINTIETPIPLHLHTPCNDPPAWLCPICWFLRAITPFSPWWVCCTVYMVIGQGGHGRFCNCKSIWMCCPQASVTLDILCQNKGKNPFLLWEFMSLPINLLF